MHILAQSTSSQTPTEVVDVLVLVEVLVLVLVVLVLVDVVVGGGGAIYPTKPQQASGVGGSPVGAHIKSIYAKSATVSSSAPEFPVCNHWGTTAITLLLAAPTLRVKM